MLMLSPGLRITSKIADVEENIKRGFPQMGISQRRYAFCVVFFFFPNVHKAFPLGLSTCHYGLGDPSHGNLISVTAVGLLH